MGGWGGLVEIGWFKCLFLNYVQENSVTGDECKIFSLKTLVHTQSSGRPQSGKFNYIFLVCVHCERKQKCLKWGVMLWR
jgi:hypothetical protein